MDNKAIPANKKFQFLNSDNIKKEFKTIQKKIKATFFPKKDKKNSLLTNRDNLEISNSEKIIDDVIEGLRKNNDLSTRLEKQIRKKLKPSVQQITGILNNNPYIPKEISESQIKDFTQTLIKEFKINSKNINILSKTLNEIIGKVESTFLPQVRLADELGDKLKQQHRNQEIKRLLKIEHQNKGGVNQQVSPENAIPEKSTEVKFNNPKKVTTEKIMDEVIDNLRKVTPINPKLEKQIRNNIKPAMQELLGILDKNPYIPKEVVNLETSSITKFLTDELKQSSKKKDGIKKSLNKVAKDLRYNFITQINKADSLGNVYKLEHQKQEINRLVNPGKSKADKTNEAIDSLYNEFIIQQNNVEKPSPSWPPKRKEILERRAQRNAKNALRTNDDIVIERALIDISQLPDPARKTLLNDDRTHFDGAIGDILANVKNAQGLAFEPTLKLKGVGKQKNMEQPKFLHSPASLEEDLKNMKPIFNKNKVDTLSGPTSRNSAPNRRKNKITSAKGK